MSRPRKFAPSYLLHKPSGQARVRVRVDGRYRDVYLGEYGSPESLERYLRLLAEHLGATVESGNTRKQHVASRVQDEQPIATLALRYVEFADACVAKGAMTDQERGKIARFVNILVQLYGNTAAREFGPRKLKAVREKIIVEGNVNTAKFDEPRKLLEPGEPLSRGYVNALTQALVRMFKWAASEELVPASVHDALLKVEGLRKGRDLRVREPEAVRPVPDEHFWPVVATASLQIATMLQVQRLSGMRPDEVTIMRPCDVDRNGDVWSYRPENHKTEWLGHEKVILLGPRSQKLLSPWFEVRQPTDYLFSPREAAEANARELEKRRRAPSSRRVRTSQTRPQGEHYNDRGYRQAVIRACKRASVSAWTPGQLRHNAGTTVRGRYGAEAAQLVLGHRKLSTTEIYAERNAARYEEFVKEIG